MVSKEITVFRVASSLGWEGRFGRCFNFMFGDDLFVNPYYTGRIAILVRVVGCALVCDIAFYPFCLSTNYMLFSFTLTLISSLINSWTVIGIF